MLGGLEKGRSDGNPVLPLEGHVALGKSQHLLCSLFSQQKISDSTVAYSGYLFVLTVL